MASDTPPMPPSGYPQLPSWPSPTSPMEWWAITYAVPGSHGPAHVPMMPLTAISPLTCGDSNQSSSRSAMLMVSSRVISAVRRGVMLLRSGQASLARSSRSDGRLRADVRRHMGEQRAHHLGDAADPVVVLGQRVRVLLGELGQLLVRALGVVLVDDQRPTLGERLVGRAHRMNLVAVPLQVQFAHDGRRHQAHHIGQPGDPQLRRVLPR